MKLSIIIFSDLVKVESWSAKSVEPGKTVWMGRLTWLYNVGNGYNQFQQDMV